MSAAVNSLARTTVLDAVADTVGSTPGLRPAELDDGAIKARRDRRWRVPVSLADNALPLVIESQTAAMDWSARFRRSAPPAISFFVSLAIHLIVLLAAALVAVGVHPEVDNTIFVESVTTDVDREELVTLAAPLKKNTTTAEEDASPEPYAPVELDPGLLQEGAPAVALIDISGREAGDWIGDIAGLADGAASGLPSEDDGTASNGDGGNAAGDNGTEFFGVQSNGSKFVFVCDCSGSMMGVKWAELNRELSRCIGELGPGKSFYIIFFDGEMHAMFEPVSREPALLDATSENVEKARLWIAEKSLGSNTSPCDSMKFAARLEPDTIFLLTDGEFNDYTAPYMRGFNRKRVSDGKAKVVVHTIGFFSQKHQMVLERIAKDSGGTYRFVGGPMPPARTKRKSQNVIARPIGLPVFAGPGPIVPLAPPRGD